MVRWLLVPLMMVLSGCFGAKITDCVDCFEHETSAEPFALDAMAVGCGGIDVEPLDAPVAVYWNGLHNISTYRIPAIGQAADGSLLAFAEARFDSSADFGRIALVQRRSVDGGATWGPVEFLAENGNGKVGDPTVVLTSSERLLLLSTWTPAFEGSPPPRPQIMLHSSHDHGVSWNGPHDITPSVLAPAWNGAGTGPGHGIQMPDGRLVVAARHMENGVRGSHLILSDDDGETWYIGAVSTGDGVVNPNESIPAWFSGGLVVATRDQLGSSAGHRFILTSPDGTVFDGPPRPMPVVAPMAHASLAACRDDVAEYLLFTAPHHPERRNDLCLSRSMDGETWEQMRLVQPGRSGYSDMVGLGSSQIGILYEAGLQTSHDLIAFRGIPLGELAGAPCPIRP